MSEYYNLSSTPIGEWTELLVVSDNISIVGYTLRDNSFTADLQEWQGGVRFKNVPLWQHLRAGTIIVINHRGNLATDDNKSDGYIEIGAEDTAYFEKRVFSGHNIGEWSIIALNIAQDGDIVQIIDENDNHVHCLAHMPVATGDYMSLPTTKSCYQGTVQDSGSVRVIPGLNLNAYNSHFGKTETTASTKYVTKGLPNNSSASTDQNSIYWKKLRAPVWDNPNFNINFSPDSTILSWNNATNPFPSDNTQGYLIVRSTIDDFQPVDGVIYKPGDKSGSSIVLANVSSLTVSYVDKIPLTCDNKYIYTVYAYRYNADDLGQDKSEFNRRGRIYNIESFAKGEANVYSSAPGKPWTNIVDTITVHCQGESVSLFTTNYPIFKYNWYKDYRLYIPDTCEITVSQTGTYYVEITNIYGCKCTSDTFTIIFVPNPLPVIFVNDNYFPRDTTLVNCNSGSFTLKTFKADSVTWMKDGAIFKVGTDTILNVTDSGEYWAILENGKALSGNTWSGICRGITPHITIIKHDYNYKFNIDTLSFHINRRTANQTKTVSLKNIGNQTVYFSEIDFPTKFTILSSGATRRILPGDSNNIDIEFAPVKPGIYNDYLTYYDSCNTSARLYISGIKDSTDLVSSVKIIDFSTKLICDTLGTEKIIKLYNTDINDLIIDPIIVNSPYFIDNSQFPLQLLSKDSLDLTIKILPIKRGLFNDTIRIPYHNGTAIDTLKIPVKCEIFDTEFSDGYEILQFPAISESENYKDTTLTLYNKTEIALNIKITPIITDVVFSGVPAAIDPGDSAVVGIRLMPSSYGDLEYDFNFVEELCGETHPLKILGSRYGNFYRFDRDSVDFGTIYNCGPTNPVVNNINLFAKTTTKDTIRIISVEISSPFTVNINAGDILKDTNNLIITFPDCPDGDYTGYLKLKIDPGSKELMLPLKGSRHTTSVDLLNKIDFGRLDIGDSVIKILALHNSGKVPVKFSGILSIPAPFYIINPVDSIFLNPDQTFEYQIGYYPTIEAADSISIFLDMTDPCQSTFRVDLTGSAKINNLKGLTFTLPQITAKPDEIISLPVTLQSDGNIAGNLSVESLLMKISYNPTLFFPIFADTTSINLQNGAKISEFKEIKPGIFSVRVDFTNPSGITNGTLFNLTGRAMEGNDSSTALTYDSIQIIPDNKVPITKNDGLLKLNSHFLTDLNGNFNISLASGNPTTGRAVLSIEVPSDGQSKLSLINFEGGEILSFPKEYLKKGKNEIILDMTQNSPGVYLAVIWFGQNVKILKIVYIRD